MEDLRPYIEIDDGQIIFRTGDLSITATVETVILFRADSGLPAKRVRLDDTFWTEADDILTAGGDR